MGAQKLAMISIGLAIFLSVGDGANFCSSAAADNSAASSSLTADQKKELTQLENEGIKYFLDNQLDNGITLDRQTNFAAPDNTRWCSISASGMGLIAICLAEKHNMITRAEAITRVKKALVMAKSLPEIHGLMAHFFDPVSLKWQSGDQVSTIDSGWFLAGALWAAQYLKDEDVTRLAYELYDRVDWNYWAHKDTTSGASILCMGMDDKGNHWKALWDRANSEAAFLYVLAVGAREKALPAASWIALKPYDKKVAGMDLAGGDLGLFTFQYSNELMDLHDYKGSQVDLSKEAIKGAKANYQVCRDLASKYKTFEHFWGLSAGDGPPDQGQTGFTYRPYAPGSDVDGTAHVMATLASVDVAPEAVLDNVKAAEEQKSPSMHGRYGFSNINLDKNWVSPDVVGIDVGVAVMALENLLDDNEVRRVWEELPSSKRAAERMAKVAETVTGH